MKRLSFLILLIIPIFLLADINYSLSESELSKNATTHFLQTPGEPIIEYHAVKILIPFGEKVANITVELENEKILKNRDFEIAKFQQPINKDFKIETIDNYEVLNNNAFYPYSNFKNLGTQFMKGYQILYLSIYDSQLNPVTKELKQFSQVTIIIETEKDEITRIKQNKRLSTKPVRFLKKVLNNSAKSSYIKTYSSTLRNLPNSSDPYQMIIVTSETTEPFFSDFLAWKNDKGISTTIFTMEDIYDNYDGVDNADKLRNFVIDAYETYSSTSTPLEYLILGGDTEIVPFRGCYGEVGSYTDNGIPTDMYFSCLDGDWDADGDLLFGETNDSVDLLPEIAVGRITAETEIEFQNFFNKAYTYIDQSSYTNDVVYFLGENLDNNPTWGGDYTDEIEQYLPNDYHLYKRYQKNGNYSTAAVIEAYNGGLGLINHMGHANTNFMMGLSGTTVQQFTNDEYGIVYSQGCYPASFDIAESAGSESVSEHLIMADGGALAFIGNTRYGWYSQGSTNGASQAFAHKFFDGIFNEEITELGNALDHSKVEMVDQIMNHSVMRWVCYELVLFGDPSISIKEPLGTYPMLEPKNIVFDDITGDNDGYVNPGENVRVSLSAFNHNGWNDAIDVYAKISFADQTVQIQQDSIFFGVVVDGSEVNSSDYFELELPEEAPLNDYEYTITMYSQIDSETTFEKSYKQNLELSINQSNWPFQTTSIYKSGFYFNEDNNKIYAPDYGANLHEFDAFANEEVVSGDISSETIYESAAFADIDEDGIEDVIIATRSGKIIAYSLANNEIFTFQSNDEDNVFLKSPIVADINNDNHLEVIATGLNKKLYAVDYQGNLLDGFPYNFDETVLTNVACEDLNQNGYKEIIFGSSTGTIFAIDHQGNSINNFPINVDSGIYASPIILENRNTVFGLSNNSLIIVNSQGQIITNIEIEGKIVDSVIAADFDNDGPTELAFATTSRKVYIVEQDGTILENWPKTVSATINKPALAADVNNDNDVDLLLQLSNGNLHIWNASGNEFGYSPVPVDKYGNNPALLADFDNDNDLDLIFSSDSCINMLDIKTEKGSKLPWTIYRGNYRRTASYLDGGNPTGITINPISDKFIVNQSYPNPFYSNNSRSPLNISFSISKPSKVTTSIYNVKGQKVIELDSRYYEKGKHSITWNATDSNETKVSSGIYFYRVKSDKNSITKKMIIIQ